MDPTGLNMFILGSRWQDWGVEEGAFVGDPTLGFSSTPWVFHYLRGNWKTGDLQTPCFPVGHIITMMCLNEYPFIHVRQYNLYQLIIIYLDHSQSIWLHIWVHSSLVGGLEHVLFFHTMGISSSQLTNSIIFQRGRSTTNQVHSRESEPTCPSWAIYSLPISWSSPGPSSQSSRHIIVIGSSAADGLRGGGSQGVFISWWIHLGKL